MFSFAGTAQEAGVGGRSKKAIPDLPPSAYRMCRVYQKDCQKHSDNTALVCTTNPWTLYAPSSDTRNTRRRKTRSFSPFAAVSLFGVAGLVETFPSFSVSGPLLLDGPGFQVFSDSIVPPQLWSSSRELSSIFISATARMFSVSPLRLTCPNHSSLLHLITVAITSIFTSSRIS